MLGQKQANKKESPDSFKFTIKGHPGHSMDKAILITAHTSQAHCSAPDLFFNILSFIFTETTVPFGLLFIYSQGMGRKLLDLTKAIFSSIKLT